LKVPLGIWGVGSSKKAKGNAGHKQARGGVQHASRKKKPKVAGIYCGSSVDGNQTHGRLRGGKMRRDFLTRCGLKALGQRGSVCSSV